MRNYNFNVSKRNIKLIIAYDGSNYAGWQRLGNTGCKKPSIQAVLEKNLSKILEEDIKVIGSGRTDAGVHALGQVANFYCNSKQASDDIQKGLNAILPEDLSILQIEEVEAQFHSRYSAKAKTYEYRIDNGLTQSVFSRKYTYYEPEPINVKSMQKAATYLIGTHDFRAFSTNHSDGKSAVRTIDCIEVYKENNKITITISGNGFLYNMVRIIVGTLLEVGKGMRHIEDMKSILESGDRQKAGITISPQGLFLSSVKY